MTCWFGLKSYQGLYYVINIRKMSQTRSLAGSVIILFVEINLSDKITLTLQLPFNDPRQLTKRQRNYGLQRLIMTS